MSTTLQRWSEQDLPLLRIGNLPSMTKHLGGPESDADLEERHHRYLRLWDEGGARMFTMVEDGSAVGGIGWWPTSWRGQEVYEAGWFVVPAAQGKGVARRALGLIIRDAVENGSLNTLTAFPEVSNAASNALCSQTGFAMHGTDDFPFRGVTLRVNAWALDLRAVGAAGPTEE